MADHASVWNTLDSSCANLRSIHSFPLKHLVWQSQTVMPTLTHIKSVLKENHIDFFFNKRKHTGIKSNSIIATVLGLTAVILKRKLFTAYSTFIPFEKSSNVIHSWFICPVAPMRIKGPNWWLCSNQSWAWPIETTTELETPLSPKSETGDTVFSAITPH